MWVNDNNSDFSPHNWLLDFFFLYPLFFSMLQKESLTTSFYLPFFLIKPVVPKLFWCADHLKDFSDLRSSEYWFISGLADHMGWSREPQVNHCIKLWFLLLFCLLKFLQTFPYLKTVVMQSQSRNWMENFF